MMMVVIEIQEGGQEFWMKMFIDSQGGFGDFSNYLFHLNEHPGSFIIAVDKALMY